jgi:HEAT repeat protein
MAGRRLISLRRLRIWAAKEGTVALEGICHDSGEPEWVRTDAARHLFDLHDHACLTDLRKLMESGNESDTRIDAINIVSQLKDRTASESAQIERLTLEALDDPDTHLRLYAVITLGDLRDTTAIPYLRMAIQAEKEDIIKSQMETSLRSLLALKPS